MKKDLLIALTSYAPFILPVLASPLIFRINRTLKLAITVLLLLVSLLALGLSIYLISL